MKNIQKLLEVKLEHEWEYRQKFYYGKTNLDLMDEIAEMLVNFEQVI